MKVLRRVLVAATPLLLSACSEAEVKQAVSQAEAKPASATAVAATDEAALRARFGDIGVEVQTIQETAMAGILEVATTGGVVYSDYKGDNFIAGTLYAFDESGRPVDVLAEKQAPLNAKKIEGYADDMIVYKADEEKYVVTIFTDTTCGYCVRLHSQMQGYNDLGITVRYLAYPRQGPRGDVAEQMAKIWCSTDPAQSMHAAKIERNFSEQVDDFAQCSDKVAEQYSLGRELGITGTPAVFLPDGKLVAGYMPPAGLYQRLQQM
jgi:thiol:disulfide interchange protein DsbC